MNKKPKILSSVSFFSCSSFFSSCLVPLPYLGLVLFVLFFPFCHFWVSRVSFIYENFNSSIPIEVFDIKIFKSFIFFLSYVLLVSISFIWISTKVWIFMSLHIWTSQSWIFIVALMLNLCVCLGIDTCYCRLRYLWFEFNVLWILLLQGSLSMNHKRKGSSLRRLFTVVFFLAMVFLIGNAFITVDYKEVITC